MDVKARAPEAPPRCGAKGVASYVEIQEREL